TTRRKTGHHRIQGISDEFIPALVNLSALSEPLDVADGDAILMAQKLAKELGLGVGISSGANVIAAIRTAETLPTGATVVTILCDSNKKYLSTDLFQHEPVKDGYLSPQVTFERFDSLPMPHSE
ncbi:MAG TPA: cysteine synthase, partial [Planctomycetota bacterium]|nr:cysteine synthase [Planctomycetota bacterium]